MPQGTGDGANDMPHCGITLHKLKPPTNFCMSWLNPADVIGRVVCVYWDGDERWFDARVQDADGQNLSIFYYADSTAETTPSDELQFVLWSKIVAAKVKGHPWWPATVQDYSDHPGNTRERNKQTAGQICCKFFGDDSVAWLKPKDVKPFETLSENTKVHSKQLYTPHC